MCRAAAINVVQALAQRVADASTLAELFNAFKRLLDGSAEGKLRGIHDRSGLVNAVATLAASPELPGTLASDVAEFLCSLYRQAGRLLEHARCHCN